MEVLGFIGAGMLLGAYFMLNSGRWQAISWSFQLTNIIAALLLVIYSFSKDATANVVLNSIFVVIGLYGVYQIINKKRR